MKKTIALLLSLLLPFTMFSSCRKMLEPDIWDGSVATAFASGDGTKSKPYVIEKASQLAFLAQEINDGKAYSGKYFSLACNLDLNNIEWTPIGNGTYSFCGFFDGNGYTISNLKISNGAYFEVFYATDRVSKQYTTGLFGICINSTIQNLTIDHAEITVQNTIDRDTVMAGVLSGSVRANASTEISNIKISNANIISDFTQEKIPLSLRLAGVAGELFTESNAEVTLQELQSEIGVSIERGTGAYNRVGGLFGFLSADGTCNVKNCASYLSVSIDKENCYVQDNYFGAFGAISSFCKTFVLQNIFSKVSVNKLHDYSHGYSAYTANAIIGEALLSDANKDNATIEFKNLFGYVEQVDESTSEIQTTKSLYELPIYAGYTETNCQGCKTLPDAHGFDKKIWDLSDFSLPKIR